MKIQTYIYVCIHIYASSCTCMDVYVWMCYDDDVYLVKIQVAKTYPPYVQESNKQNDRWDVLCLPSQRWCNRGWAV
jgi:exonuclease I